MNSRHAVIYWTGFTVVLVLLVVAPLALPEFWRRFLTEILIWGLLAMSSDLLIGMFHQSGSKRAIGFHCRLHGRVVLRHQK